VDALIVLALGALFAVLMTEPTGFTVGAVGVESATPCGVVEGALRLGAGREKDALYHAFWNVLHHIARSLARLRQDHHNFFTGRDDYRRLSHPQASLHLIVCVLQQPLESSEVVALTLHIHQQFLNIG
jgi:hypothetical protein